MLYGRWVFSPIGRKAPAGATHRQPAAARTAPSARLIRRRGACFQQAPSKQKRCSQRADSWALSSLMPMVHHAAWGCLRFAKRSWTTAGGQQFRTIAAGQPTSCSRPPRSRRSRKRRGWALARMSGYPGSPRSTRWAAIDCQPARSFPASTSWCRSMSCSASPMALCSACGCGRCFPRPAFTGFRAAQ